MRRSAYGNILEISSFAGKILLESGAEITRVEQTIRHICLAYGVKRCECFAAPPMISISIIGKNGEVHSVTRRITRRSVNLSKVERINQFSRRIAEESSSFEVIKAELVTIDQMPRYSFWQMILTAATGTAAFTLVFGGGLSDVICGFLCGGLVHVLVEAMSKKGFGPFLINLAGGGACALLAGFFTAASPGGDWWIVTISALMLLVPGMLMTNAFRDLAAGDFLSGVSRTAEALCIAASLASGAALVIFMMQLGGI